MNNKEASNTADWTEADVSAILDNMRANNEARKMSRGISSALADKHPLPTPDSVRVKALKAKSIYELESELEAFVQSVEVVTIEYSTNAIAYGSTFVEVEREYSVVILYK